MKGRRRDVFEGSHWKKGKQKTLNVALKLMNKNRKEQKGTYLKRERKSRRMRGRETWGSGASVMKIILL